MKDNTMIPHKKIDAPNDFDLIRAGDVVYVNGFPKQRFVIVNCGQMYVDSKTNMVSLMTIDSNGKPHMVEVCAYCIVLPAEYEDGEKESL